MLNTRNSVQSSIIKWCYRGKIQSWNSKIKKRRIQREKKKFFVVVFYKLCVFPWKSENCDYLMGFKWENLSEKSHAISIMKREKPKLF